MKVSSFFGFFKVVPGISHLYASSCRRHVFPLHISFCLYLKPVYFQLSCLSLSQLTHYYINTTRKKIFRYDYGYQRVSLLRPFIHRLFPCDVCPCSLVTHHTDNEFVLFNGTYPLRTKLSKDSLSVWRVIREQGHTPKGDSLWIQNLTQPTFLFNTLN